jgi:hypothetical protein
MTQEDKELLLRDLCARSPYNVKCNVWYGPKSPALNKKDKYTDDILETIDPKKGSCTFHNAIGYDFGVFPVEHVKPYLRPMSSMTEEEIREFTSLIFISDSTSYGYLKECVLFAIYSAKALDWLNAHHFDYRELIEKDLALEAPERMYK